MGPYPPKRPQFSTAACLLLLVLHLRPNIAVPSEKSADAAPRQPHARLIGKDAPPGRFPYACSLSRRDDGRHICGGTLIRPHWVLTAAHCVDSEFSQSTGNSPLVRCGVRDLDESYDESTLYNGHAYLHEDWTGDLADGYDIAMVRLNRAANFTIPDTATAPNDFTIGKKFAAVGWGVQEDGTRPSILQLAETLEYIPPEKCKAEIDGVQDHTLCAGLSNEDTCHGDSGGPLLVPHIVHGAIEKGWPRFDQIVGVTYAGKEECGHEAAGMYIDVGYFSDWIKVVAGEGQDQTESSDAGEKRPLPKSGQIDARTKNAEAYLAEDLEELTKAELLTEMLWSIQTDNAEKAEGILMAGLDPNSALHDEENSRFPLTKAATLLHWAAVYDARRCTQVLAAYDADLDKRDHHWAPLHAAAISSSVATIEVLLDLEANLEARGKYRYTPLHAAVRYHATAETIELLIENGADVDVSKVHGEKPLHTAVRYGSVGVVRLLIENAEDIDAKAENGATPLHWAALDRKQEAAELLLENGASVNARIDGGSTALLLTAGFGGAEIAELLLDAGADVNRARDDGHTALHEAARHGDADTVELLIEAGAKVNAATDRKWRPLHEAVGSGDLKTVKLLLDAKAKVNAVRGDGQTPLHEAAQESDVQIAKLLVEAGADVNPGRTPTTPLHLAVAFGCIDIVKLLVENGADVNAMKDLGGTPLHDAARRGDAKVIKLLLKSGADVKAKSSKGWTPLHEASRWSPPLIEILIEEGARVSAADNSGQTPLHVAASWGNLLAAEVLVDADAGTRRKDDDGMTPFDVVCSHATCDRETRKGLEELLAD